MRRNIVIFALLAFGAGCGGSSDTDGVGGSASGAAGASGKGGSAGSGGTCTTDCGFGRTCCAGQCANSANDPKNCGSCGVQCPSGTYCDGSGNCTQPPCDTTCGGGLCCGSQCCNQGELCCDPQGPISSVPACTPPDDRGTCPMGCAPLCVCASPDTPIATPDGDRPIASLRVGDLVYSSDGRGVKVVPILELCRTPVRAHRIMRVVLANGATLELSPGHPTADGRKFQDLHAGDTLDGVPITSATSMPYAHDATYDILPDTNSGTYYAGGVLVGSTLVSAEACRASR